ncbi:MAG: Aspartyl/glutamyl-tRNA(Asn/Gln) amidotransferase subunit B [Parcubacteria group bacterium GW2011_GWC1_43_30]|nr:MAG: Aspartyl/glutamyl-tRNA(Asn/Gln) amidotransferase subunit B [Parcubacteria group bacterium GW2011_GWC1_43_30]
MSEYILTVGLEIHVELATRTKMFCNSKNDSNEKRPNVNICPVCMGYPGTLPVINQDAVGKVLRLGVALDGEIADYTEFDRKNYFYPDIPKGYQISQYKNPLVSGGELMGVDFNRAGVPLMELVTEPVIKTATEASNFARELQLLLKYLDVSGANMEKGEMRVEANISLAPRSLGGVGVGKLGTKVEVKNLNSFKVVEKAIKFEMERQIEMLEKGEEVVQETRGWDENKEITFSQRLKESAHDYRYFPDPDLPRLFIKAIPEFDERKLRTSLPELPWQKRERYKRDFGLKEGDIEIYIREPEWGRLIESVAEILKDAELVQLASNYVTSDLKTLVPARSLAEVVKMISAGEISSRGAKDILKIIQEKGGEPRAIANDKNLIQESDREVLEKIAKEVLKENPEAPISFLVGQAIKKSGGRANPVVLQEILKGRKGGNGNNGEA